MLLTITTTHRPATDLGFLLAKHPQRCQRFSLAFGEAQVVYPEANEQRCTAALILDLDPVGLVRGRGPRGGEAHAAGQYVNDRPYAASSFLSVAIAQVLRSALQGHSSDRPELVDRAIPLEAHLPVLPCRGGEALLRRLFEPLGYAITTTRLALDPRFPDWGDSRYHDTRIAATVPLRTLLTHLYVLLPVLDDDKHYFVGEDELEKLLAKGEGWLQSHPERELIARRYLKYRGHLAREAIERLMADEGEDVDERDASQARAEDGLEERISLNEQRMGAVLAALEAAGASSVLDLGCGEGRLLSRLLVDKAFLRIVGVDVSMRALEIAASRLKLERMPERQRTRIELLQGAFTYRDARFAGFDAVCAVEVVEHVEPSRLGAFERTLFEFARPTTAIVTTPNREYNALFDGLEPGALRHRDHRFEWTRAEFEWWAGGVAARNGYAVRFLPVGPVDGAHGAPTQMGIFTR